MRCTMIIRPLCADDLHPDLFSDFRHEQHWIRQWISTKSGWQLPSYWRFTIWGEKGSVEFKYGTGKILFADGECTEAQEIDCEAVTDTWLTDFVKPFDAAALKDVLASQEAVLTIQKAADDK